MNNPVGWFEIYVDDMERAKLFYETVFEITLEELGDPTGKGTEMWSFPANMESYGAAGALIKMEGFPSGNNSTIVYFSCNDCAVEESRVADAGGEIQAPKTSLGEYGYCTLAIDTEGNIFGLHSLT